MNLTGKRRPQQAGRVIGLDPSGTYEHSAPVTWVVDTGAEVTLVRDRVGSQFGYKPVKGVCGKSTTGDSFYLVTGLQAEFSVESHDGQDGSVSTVRSGRRIGIKRNDAGSDLLGMSQVSDVCATVHWNPRTGSGSMRAWAGGPSAAAAVFSIVRSVFGRLTRRG